MPDMTATIPASAPAAQSRPRPARRGKFRVPFGTMSVTPHAVELIAQSLNTRRLTCGPLVREFEARFAEIMGTDEAVSVSTGTDADTLALAVLHDFGAQRGDEVIVPALSFVATGNAVVHAGFTPVFVDVRRDTLNIDVERIEAAITPKTRAIMPVHLMGKPAEMDTILAIARKHGLYVIEDAAEAHGARYKGRMIGSIGHMAAFSLYAAHIISTVEGGIVTTSDARFAEILRSLRSHGRGCNCRECVLSVAQNYCPKRFRGADGQDVRFTFERIGYSSKMNELEAAVGLGNLEQFEEIVQKRRENLRVALELLKPYSRWLATLSEESHEEIGPHAIPLVVQEEAGFTRTQLAEQLESHGVETRTLFASMPTQCPGFAYLGYELGQFPNAEYVGQHGIHIGVHQDLEIADMEYVAETIRGFLAERGVL